MHIVSKDLRAFLGLTSSNRKKAMIKFGLILSLILSLLSILTAQLLNTINGQANALLSDTVQNVQLQTKSPLIPIGESETTQLSSISTSSSNPDPNGSIQVVINGENVPVPPSGVIHKETKTDNGQSSVDVVVQNGQITTSAQTQSNGASFGHSQSFSSTHSSTSTSQFNNGTTSVVNQ